MEDFILLFVQLVAASWILYYTIAMLAIRKYSGKFHFTFPGIALTFSSVSAFIAGYMVYT